MVGAAALQADGGREPELARDGEVVASRYAVAREVGRGSMGTVYEALDLELSTVVAIKVLTPFLAQIPEVVDRLRREIVLGRRVAHPGVCRLFDLGRVDDTWFITMEYVEGWTLDRVIGRRDVSRARAIAIGIELFDALEAIHRADVVHRDVKPGNVRVRPDGRVVVLDLGLAGDLAAGELSSVRVGTPSFWAPEQEEGLPATPRSDIYAAARVLQSLLRSSGDRIPSAVSRVLARCLARDPAKRFARAGDVARALARAVREPSRRHRVAASFLWRGARDGLVAHTSAGRASAAREEIPA